MSPADIAEIVTVVEVAGVTPHITEQRRVVRAKYPDAKVATRDHATVGRYRVKSGSRRAFGQTGNDKFVGKSWCRCESAAWAQAYQHVMYVMRVQRGDAPLVL